MGVIAQRAAARRAKAVGDPGNDFGGALSTSILAGSSSVSQRSTGQLLAAATSSTWPHLSLRLKAIRLAETAWMLLRPGPRSMTSGNRLGAEWVAHKSRLEVPVVGGKAAKDRQLLVADLKESGFLVEQPDHPFLRMQRQGTMWSNNPNLQYGGFQVSTWESTTLEAVGEWFLALVRDPDMNFPFQWLPIPPHWVRTPSGQQKNYEITRLGLIGSKGVPPRDMAVHRVANPDEPFSRGRGDLHATDVEVRLDEAASTHMASSLDNHGVPALLMAMAGLTEPEKKIYEHEWKRDLTGPLRANMTKFLRLPEGAALKDSLLIQELQQTPVQLEMSTLRGHERDALLMGNRVPPLSAGEQRSGNRAMALVAEKLLAKNAITPAREGTRAFYQSRFFEPVGSRPAEYGDGWIVMWEAPEMTDEGSRDRMMAQVPAHFSRAQFLRVAGAQPQPGDENIYVIGSNQVVYDKTTNQVLFAPPQPQGDLPFGGADMETPVAKLETQLVELSSLADRLEFGVAEQGV